MKYEPKLKIFKSVYHVFIIVCVASFAATFSRQTYFIMLGNIRVEAHSDCHLDSDNTEFGVRCFEYDDCTCATLTE